MRDKNGREKTVQTFKKKCRVLTFLTKYIALNITFHGCSYFNCGYNK